MENILNNTWFISFKVFETADGIVTRERDFAGKVVEAVADGWFLVEIFGSGWNVAERKVMPVAEFKTARFYYAEIAFRDVYCDKPMEAKR